jgi:hypothetical protein
MFDGVLAVRYSYPVRVGEHALGATGAGTYADDMFLNGKGPAYGLEINLAKMLNIKPGNIKSMTLSCDRYNPTSPSGDETIRDRFMFVTTLGF